MYNKKTLQQDINRLSLDTLALSSSICRLNQLLREGGFEKAPGLVNKECLDKIHEILLHARIPIDMYITIYENLYYPCQNSEKTVNTIETASTDRTVCESGNTSTDANAKKKNENKKKRNMKVMDFEKAIEAKNKEITIDHIVMIHSNVVKCYGHVGRTLIRWDGHGDGHTLEYPYDDHIDHDTHEAITDDIYKRNEDFDLAFE